MPADVSQCVGVVVTVRKCFAKSAVINEALAPESNNIFIAEILGFPSRVLTNPNTIGTKFCSVLAFLSVVRGGLEE